MTIAAVGHAASHGAASQVVPQGKSNQEQQILLLLVLAAVVIFIQADRTNKPQNGAQYAALGVVGFILLVLAQFWAEAALAMTILFVVSIILNSPNGIPVVGKISNPENSSPAVAGAVPFTGNEVTSTVQGQTVTLPQGTSIGAGGSVKG